MGFADLGDVQLVYTDEGTGDPPMLFVHGYTCDSHDWSWQLPHFAAEHRVIALDLRGHRRSSTLESGYEPLVFAADVARLVEHLGCSPVVAVWHSMGALVVSALAVEHPEMVRALVAVDPGYLVADATVDGIPALKAAVEASDPVPFVQGLLGGTDTRASVPALRAWHLRRVAGLPAHVLRDTLTNISAGGEVTAMRSGGEGYLRCEAARCCRSTPAPRARPWRRRCLPMPAPRPSRGRAVATGCTRNAPPSSTRSWTPGWSPSPDPRSGQARRGRRD